MSMTFHKLSRPKSLPEEIAQQIRDQIAAGDLAPGARLPSEARLQAEFDVGRSAVREAISRLKDDGLVVTRQGVGAFVAEDPHGSKFRIQSTGPDLMTGLRYILEMRLEIEVAVAGMAARRRSKSDLRRLGDAVAALSAAVERQDGQPEAAQRAFWSAVAAAARNPHMNDLIRYLEGRFADRLQTVRVPQAGQGADLVAEYETIRAAIAAGDPDKARRAAWRHLLRAADRLGLRGLQGWDESRMTVIGDMTETEIPRCAAADPAPRPARFTPPPGSCDCHAHVFGPAETYPYVHGRTYTPPDAPLAQYRKMLDTLGIDRGVIVQPSVYGTDNRATLDAVRAGGDRYRAVVVVDEEVTEAELERMHAAGARGVRVNLIFRSGIEVSDVRKLADKIAPLDWHMQLLIDVSEFADLRDTLGSLPVDTVIDHIGHMPTSRGVDHPGFRDMLALLRDGRSWVKLSGSYRITSETETPYEDVAPLARAIVEANPDRVLWATDWPHPYVNVPMPNDGALLDMLADWVPDEETRQRILVDNPARLYGFDPVA
ncbi:amidohydrolase family protein [Roseivivax marinus]|uniref:amidohydrolase family protein n=1 Tax=Roseivivax marinus TaxID=1379903 RepID=UPI00273E03E1|nr:amidohydrolase family protein [Roseivivax marinus]